VRKEFTKDQQLVIDHLARADGTLITDLIELDGSMDSVSPEVAEAWWKLGNKEQLEVIGQAADFRLSHGKY
jgi:hypothetical protein